MKIKSPSKRGKRSICICQNCGDEFLELDIKIRAGKGKFCCNDCYKTYRKLHAKDPKELNRLYQKKNKYNLSKEEYHKLFLQQNNKCAICGNNDIWNNDELHLILDHIDGDATNNKRTNLRLICPNCDSQLPTFKARNIGKSTRKYKPYKEVIKVKTTN